MKIKIFQEFNMTDLQNKLDKFFDDKKVDIIKTKLSTKTITNRCPVHNTNVMTVIYKEFK
jgi:hypothetical protein